MATSTTENFVPQLNRVLNSTETLTQEAINALMDKGIDTEVKIFKADVTKKIADTRARLNKVKNVTGTPALVTLGTKFSSPNYKLNLLKVLNESLINTIQQVITQMGTGNTEFIRRALGYIQILLIQLQNLVVIFNRLDKRMGRIENHFKIPRRLTNTSQQLEELMKLPPPPPAPAPAPAPDPAPARTGLFRNTFARRQNAGRRKTRAGKRKTRGMPRRRKKSSSKTRRRNTKNRR